MAAKSDASGGVQWTQLSPSPNLPTPFTPFSRPVSITDSIWLWLSRFPFSVTSFTRLLFHFLFLLIFL